MASTYSQIYIQYVFVVKGRAQLLQKPWREKVFSYMSGIITRKNQKSLIVNGVEDHVHVFVGLKPSMCISDLARDLKNNTTNYINEQKFLPVPFAWQAGFGAFSYAHSQVKSVYRYIENQEQHHHKQTFKEEYHGILQSYEVIYDEKYLFDWLSV